MISIKQLFIIVLMFSWIQISIAADSSLLTQNYLSQWAKDNQLVGASLAVNNKVYYYGYSNKNLSKIVNEKTQFGIGSITKIFVSVVLLKLEAEGKLNLQDPITKYLPEYSKLKNITLQELMQMTAGFNDVADNSVSPLQQINASYKKYKPHQAGLWRYSNVSYQLLGVLIERITHQPLSEVISTLITSPLHLQSIYFPNQSEAFSLKEYQNNQVKISNFKNLYAAGGLISNSGDLEIFIHHLFVLKDLLPKKQYAELTTFIEIPAYYYAFTGDRAPAFGLAVFKWKLPPYGDVLTYPGVVSEGFTSAYTVVGDNVIITQSNTYNHNDFTLLWPHRIYTKNLVKNFVDVSSSTYTSLIEKIDHRYGLHLGLEGNGYSTMHLHDILQEHGSKKMTSKDEDGGFITAISLTAQCKSNPPVSFVAGSNGISDATLINANSLFQIGSVTKSFISLVILQIAQENKISIDDTTVMEKWFPEYPKWKHITLRQLMDMTSGIPGNENNLPDDIFKKLTAQEYFNKIDPIKILDLTYTLPLHFKPGTEFEYSNTNYVLLGQFIKKITHHEPENEVTMRIITKLELRNTYFAIDRGDKISGANETQLVHGYAFYPKSSHPYSFIPYGVDTLPFSLSYTNTAGAMVSTPEDINHYLHAIFNKDGMFHSYKKQLTMFVSKQTGQHMLAPTINNNQGFGLGIIGFYWNKQHPLIYLYNGTTDGFNFAWFVDPKTQTYLVFTINSRADLLSLYDALSLFSKVEKTCEI